MFKDYIHTLAEQTIAAKEAAGTVPAACTLRELTDRVKADILAAMRLLIAEGEYKGSITINKIPMLIRKKDDTETHKQQPAQ